MDIENVSFPEKPYTKLEFLLLAAQGRDGFIVAEDGGRVQGYVSTIIGNGVGLIMSIAVSPKRRRTGVGDRLMGYALNQMTKCEQVWLLVDQKNEAAISLYHKHSFRETGRIIKEYYPNGHDAVEMTR